MGQGRMERALVGKKLGMGLAVGERQGKFVSFSILFIRFSLITHILAQSQCVPLLTDILNININTSRLYTFLYTREGKLSFRFSILLVRLVAVR